MNRTTRLLLVSSLALSALLMAGCATTAKYEAQGNVAEKIGKFDKVDVRVNTDIDAARVSLGTIKKQISKGLEGRFVTIDVDRGQTSPRTLALDLQIVDYKRVGAAGRFFLGGLLGPDRVGVKGKIIDLETNKVIGEFTEVGEATLGGIVIGDAGIYRASTAMGEEIAKKLAENN